MLSTHHAHFVVLAMNVRLCTEQQSHGGWSIAADSNHQRTVARLPVHKSTLTAQASTCLVSLSIHISLLIQELLNFRVVDCVPALSIRHCSLNGLNQRCLCRLRKHYHSGKIARNTITLVSCCAAEVSVSEANKSPCDRLAKSTAASEN